MELDLIEETITQAALDLKAINLIRFDMENTSSLSDFVIICHGTSTTHVRGIADNISLNCKKADVLPLGVEGYEEGEWVLMDYNSVIVHIFLEETREIFNLEEIFETLSSEKFE